jgi:hypothetical protein
VKGKKDISHLGRRCADKKTFPAARRLGSYPRKSIIVKLNEDNIIKALYQTSHAVESCNLLRHQTPRAKCTFMCHFAQIVNEKMLQLLRTQEALDSTVKTDPDS